jgi:hypothetical protein
MSDDKTERAGAPSNAELAEQLRKDADLLEDCTPGGFESTEAIARVRLAAQRLEARSEISEAMAIRAFQVFDQYHGNAIEAMRAALAAALNVEE